MKVFIASDHAGLAAKDELKQALNTEYELIDLGPEELNPADDYPIYAKKVAEAVSAEAGTRGILVCGSGQGMAIAANKFKGIRAAVVWDEEVARETRADNDSNILSLPARFLTHVQAMHITKTWLAAPFSNQERHQRRINEIKEFEV